MHMAVGTTDFGLCLTCDTFSAPKVSLVYFPVPASRASKTKTKVCLIKRVAVPHRPFSRGGEGCDA